MSNLRKFCVVASVAAMFIVGGCGGGGGGGSSSSGSTATSQPTVKPIAVTATSYQNEKGLNIPAQTLPYSGNAAHAFGDFFQRGQEDLFIATQTYDVTKPLSQATKGAFEFWKRQADGSFVKDTTLLADSTGCVHPRKAIVADFNHDGKPDIFVACHGYDASPFPGEEAAVILSQADGSFKTTFIPYTGYFHGAAAADMTGTGNIDVVAVDPSTNGVGHTPVVFVNDGKGNFTVRTDLLPALTPGQLYYSVEALDLNGDGKPDLLFMGDDACPNSGCSQLSAPPTILVNNGTGSFANAQQLVLPTVPGTVALDATLIDSTLYLARTSDLASNFYQTRVLQSIDMKSLTSNILVNDTNASDPWIRWLFPYTTSGHTVLVDDDASISFNLQIN